MTSHVTVIQLTAYCVIKIHNLTCMVWCSALSASIPGVDWMLSWLRRHRAEWKRESVTADEARRGRVHEGTPLKPPPPLKKYCTAAFSHPVRLPTLHQCPQVYAYKYFILLFHTALGLTEGSLLYVQNCK